MLEFGLAKKKVEVVEKYPNKAVLTYLGGEKVSNFQFNKKALELMGYEGKDRKVSLGFFDGYIFLANTSGFETKEQNHITAKDYFANSLLVKKIKIEYGLDINEGFEFPLLMPTEQSEDTPYLLLSTVAMEIAKELNEVNSDIADARDIVTSEEEIEFEDVEDYGELESDHDEPSEGEIRENAFIQANAAQDLRYGATV